MDLFYVRTAHRAVSVLMRKPPIGTPSPVSFRDGKAALLGYNHPLFTSGMRIYSDSKVSDFITNITQDQSIGVTDLPDCP